MPWQFWSQISLNCENNLGLRSFPNEKQVVALPNCTHRELWTEILGGNCTPQGPEVLYLVEERVNSLFEND